MRAIYKNIINDGWRGHGCSFLAGLLFAFGFSPYHFWFICLFSIIIYFLSLSQLSAKQAALRGFCFGLGQFGHGVSWLYVSLHDYASQPLLLAACMTLICIAVFSLFSLSQAYLYIKGRFDRWPLLAFPSLWVLFEWFRLKLFTGFPWLFVGYIFTDTFLGKAIAPIFGIFGLSFLGCLISLLMLYAIRQHKKYVVVLFVLLGVIFLFSLHAWVKIDKNRKPLTVAFVQGNIPQDEKWLSENIIPTQQKYATLSQVILDRKSGIDMIIWPEAAITSFYQEAWQYIDSIDEWMSLHRVAWIFGISTFQAKKEELEFHNSVFALGQGQGIYHKQKLVPFGEYVPFADWFGRWLPFLNIPMSGYTAGSAHQMGLTAKNAFIAPFICYEILYPDLVRQAAKSTDFLLTISNDAWFGHSLAAYQHFEMAKMRAMEEGKYLLRGTNTGITAIVDPQGRTVKQAPMFVTAILVGNIYFMQGHTPFSRWGSWPVLICCILLLCICSCMQYVKRFRI